MKYNVIYQNGGSTKSSSKTTSINPLLTDTLDFEDLKNLIKDHKLDSNLHIPDEVWIENNKENSYTIPNDETWEKIEVGNFKLETETIDTTIKINCYKYSNSSVVSSEESNKQILFLPGFSDNSFLWTLSRISKFKDFIIQQGFSDIFIFDFTAIGGNKNYAGIKGLEKGHNFQKNALEEEKSGIKYGIDEMYKKIAFGLKGLIESRNDLFTNFSIAGRSAGGGLSIHLVLTFGLVVNGLNIACPGFNYNSLLENENLKIFIEEKGNRNLPIRLCHSFPDTKVNIEESNKLSKLLGDKFVNFVYYSVSKIYDNEEINHRFQEILLFNLV